MYVASARGTVATGGGAPTSGRVPATVFALGAVSLLTDISAEMVTAFLPLYLLYTLHLGYVQFGLLDGLYGAATAVLRLVGGHVADRWQRPKTVALMGYGLSALAKLAFPAVGASAAGVGAVLTADRAGKGLRTAPRDALISFAVPPGDLGRAFGVHRAMDTIGAMLGPMVTFAILATLGSSAGPVFVVSFCFALLGVIVLACFVRERRGAQPAGAVSPARAVSLRDMAALLRRQPLRRVTVVAAVLGAVTVSDAFVFVLLQRSTGMSLGVLPLLPVGTAVVFLLTAALLGRLADRVGRWPVFMAGHLPLLGVYLLLLVPGGGAARTWLLIAVVLTLHGLFYAATDGVLAAAAAALVPSELRGSGLAVVQTAQALARLASSVAFGFLLAAFAVGMAVGIAVAGLVAALGCALLITGPVVRA